MQIDYQVGQSQLIADIKASHYQETSYDGWKQSAALVTERVLNLFQWALRGAIIWK